MNALKWIFIDKKFNIKNVKINGVRVKIKIIILIEGANPRLP